MTASSEDRVGRGARLVGAGILVSRIVGLVRNKVFAYYFGDSAEADAFNAASRIPNTVRNLLGEGSISASFIPVYAAALERGDERGARALAGALLGVLLAAVAALTLAGIFLAPVLTELFAGDVAPATADLIARLLRVMFPMTGVMVLSAWCLGVQNAHRRFFVAYAAAALWSIAQIVLLLVGGPRAEDLVQLAWWLSWATLAGAILQVAAQLPQVQRVAGTVVPSFSLSAPGLRATLANFVPVVMALGLFQISSLVDLRIASMLPVGAIAFLSYANQVYLLPLSLFGVATAAAALPEMARGQARGGESAIVAGVDRALQRVLFYTIPSSAAFVVAGDLVAALLYGGGAFGLSEQRTVHFVLVGYAFGLSAYASSRVLASTFHAVQDYRTPLRSALVAITVSAVGALSLSIPFRDNVNAVAGIAGGSAAGAFVNLTLLWRAASARGAAPSSSAIRRVLLRSFAAAAGAAAVALVLRAVLPLAASQTMALVVLPAFGVTYLLAAHALGLDEAGRLFARVRRVK